MELYILIPICLIILLVVVGGYVYMFLHIMRNDPRELEFREHTGQDESLVPQNTKKSPKS